MQSAYSTKRSILFMVILLVGVTVFYMFRGDWSVQFDFQNETLTIDGPQGTLAAIPFEDISAISYYEEMDVGTEVSGGTGYGYLYGEYTNDELGSYTLMCLKKLDCFLVVTDKDGNTYAANMESKDTTYNLYTATKEYLDSLGYTDVVYSG